MLDVAKTEDATVTDIANVLYERVHAARAAKAAAKLASGSIEDQDESTPNS